MRLFPRKSNNDAATAPIENPYTAGRREWNERFGSYITQRNIGVSFGAASLLVAAIAVGGVVYIGSQSKFIPIYVLVEKLGEAVTVGRGDFAKASPEQVVKAQLASWLTDVRSVTADKVIKLSAVRRAYSMVQDGDPAKEKIDRWFGGQGAAKSNVTESKADPFARAATETVELQLKGAPLPTSPDSWQADWTEIVRDRKGKELKRLQMRIVWTVKQLPPADESQLLANPTGTFITDFSWSRQF